MATVSLAALLCSATGAAAATVTDRPLLFSFDGHDTTAGRFHSEGTNHPLDSVAVDDSSGDVYVVDGGGNEAVDRFNAKGEAKEFTAGPAAGTSSLYGPPGQLFKEQSPFFFNFPTDLAADNSGGLGGAGEGEQGRLYVSGSSDGPIDAFKPDGSYLWTLPTASVEGVCGITVDAAGYLWVGAGGGGSHHEVLEFANSGSPPAQIGSFSVMTGNHAPCRLGVDQSGKDFYIATAWYSFSFGGPDAEKYVEGSFDSVLTTSPTRSIAVDQSVAGGHIFTAEKNPEFPVQEKITRLREFEPCALPGCAGTEVAGSPFGHGLIGDGMGVAHSSYDPPGPEGPLDRLYVSDLESDTVKVFGPRTTGTAPDVTSTATSEKEVSRAKANGTINPREVPNSYHFEWKQGTSASWATAKSQPEPYPSIALPNESNESVSFHITGLKGNTTYQVRLLGTNTEAGKNQLSAYSSPDTFTTATAALPAVSINAPTANSPTSEHISGTINPQGDQTTWQVLKSARAHAGKAECESLGNGEFSAEPLQTIPSEEPGTVAVAADLTDLLPAQTYCVRITATNSGGTTNATEAFTTKAIPPSEVEAAFAAPRTDTTARINGYLNPEGEADVTYRFELSTDGINWTARPDHLSTAEARHPILVSDELADLTPATTYHYRFGLVENSGTEGSGGSAASLGEVKTFTTRTAAEMILPPNAFGEAEKRGIELVNNPDKGNQNVKVLIGQGTSPISPDGERVLWNVFGGAPGGNAGTGAAFVAQRTGPSEAAPNGWDSRSLIPPGPQQAEPENGGYALGAMTPDLAKFIFAAGSGLGGGGKTLVRLDANQHQDVLKRYEQYHRPDQVDLSADGSHVLMVDEDTRQLEDIGAGEPGEVVGYLPNGEAPECGLTGEGQSFGGFGSDGAALQWRPGYHRIATTDASRVYFQIHPNGQCNANPATWQLLERNRETGETLEVAPPSKSNALIRATPDGRSAFFVTDLVLDPADTNSDPDVYRWDEEREEDTCLTCVVPDANVRRTVMVSDDFSHVYFQSSSKLSLEATPGDSNLYALSGGEVRFVADPDSEDALAYFGGANAELSSDGNVLVFRTSEAASANHELTTDKLAGKCSTPDHAGELPCAELYRYDDRDASLECISCLRGALTTSSFGSRVDGTIGDFGMSADGSTVAFVTTQALTPLDVNNGIDVYEWRVSVQRLITDGVSSFGQTEDAAAQVRAVGAIGRDVLFSLTDPSLTDFEQDGLANLYDARIGGGFAPPSPAAHCSEESCQGPLQAAPPQSTRNSATYSGPGNVEELPKCAKNRVRRHGRCVKRRHVRKHHKRSHKRAAGVNHGGAK